MDNVFRSFYTKSDYITSYMVSMLDLQEDDNILEPSAGDGVFIDALLDVSEKAKIDACDLNPKAIEILKEKYSARENINIWQADTLFDEKLDRYAKAGGEYNKIIGNPPYGGWQEFERRDELKTKFKGHSAKETYSLFLIRCLSLLNEGGKLSFIIPDTYLFLNRHKSLRDLILNNTKISEILIFPSKFFPGVKFGYSNISIITFEKCSNVQECLTNEVRIIKDLKKDSDIEQIKNNINLDNFTVIKVKQQQVVNNEDMIFLLDNESNISDLINNAKTRLGDIADCVTGIYCGDNKRFLKVMSDTVKNSKGYPIVSGDEVDFNYVGLDGIDDSVKKYIPIAKGNVSTRYIRENGWVIDWSKEAVEHYINEKKPRFQNSQFYFKKGIVLPMVKSSKICANLIDGVVFDQSLVGVFPKNEKYLYYILGFLNSNTARTIIQIINPTANNSANYIKKIPIILPDEENLEIIDCKVKNIIKNMHEGKENEAIKEHDELDIYFKELYM
ncbi:Eco57I restriction-modification methylase domain-containing protein (plasmid) [Clostridium perfringens]|nr:N-6 DNA methylase [Clostridium perfringens]